MTFLCEKHRSQIAHSHQSSNNLWRELINMGTKAHQEGHYSEAFKLFGSAGEVASLVLEKQCRESDQESAVEMLVIATHNLSATLCAQQQNQAAEEVLTQLHCQLMAMSLNRDAKRQTRVDAVASLKTTLFSLTTHLGYQRKLDALHSVIEETERVAEQAARELFH